MHLLFQCLGTSSVSEVFGVSICLFVYFLMALYSESMFLGIVLVGSLQGPAEGRLPLE